MSDIYARLAEATGMSRSFCKATVFMVMYLPEAQEFTVDQLFEKCKELIEQSKEMGEQILENVRKKEEAFSLPENKLNELIKKYCKEDQFVSVSMPEQEFNDSVEQVLKGDNALIVIEADKEQLLNGCLKARSFSRHLDMKACIPILESILEDYKKELGL